MEDVKNQTIGGQSPPNQTVDDILTDIDYDINVVKDWYRHPSWSTESLNKMILNARRQTTLHGIRVLKHLTRIPGLNLTPGFSVGVILHDIAKYKGRLEVTPHLIDKYIGRGKWTEMLDHGLNGGAILMSIFPDIDCREIIFVFVHNGIKPFTIEPDKVPLREAAFYLFDDFIRGTKKYKIQLPRMDYNKIMDFYQYPTSYAIRDVFTIVSRVKIQQRCSAEEGV